MGECKQQQQHAVACFTSEHDCAPSSFSDIGKVVGKHPMLFALSLSENLKPTVQYLQEEVLLQQEGGGVLAKLIACYPQVLGLNMEKNIGPKLKFLREEVAIVPRRIQCNNRADLHPQNKVFCACIV
jgi:hypothetical protein